MKLASPILCLLFAVAVAGCDKPSAGDCQKAITNIRTLMGTSRMTVASGQDAAWLRSCRGAAKKKSVQCAIKATSTAELKACGLLKGAELEELEAIERAVRERAPTSLPVAPPAPAPAPAPTAAPTDPAAAPTAPTEPGTMPAQPVAPVDPSAPAPAPAAPSAAPTAPADPGAPPAATAPTPPAATAPTPPAPTPAPPTP